MNRLNILSLTLALSMGSLYSGNAAEKVASVLIQPAGDVIQTIYRDTLEIILSTSTSGARIYYDLSGYKLDSIHAGLYGSPLHFNMKTTKSVSIAAFASKEGMTQSDTTYRLYLQGPPSSIQKPFSGYWVPAKSIGEEAFTLTGQRKRVVSTFPIFLVKFK
jgi:hypothetical protein